MQLPPDAVDPAPYAGFLVQRLLRPYGIGAAGPQRAMMETEQPIEGDVWAWTDDNAKVFELLTLPAVAQRWPTEQAEVLAFLRRMCDGPFIFRRLGAPRLERRSPGPPGQGQWLHTLMDVGLDLPAGTVTAGLRFHDGRTARNLVLTGNYVQFRRHGDQITLDVEEAIADHASDEEGGSLVATHASELRFTQGGATHRLGRLTYTYRVERSSMAIAVTAALDLDPAAEVEDVVLTIGHDDLSHGENEVRYQRLRAMMPNGAVRRDDAGPAGGIRIGVEGATYYGITQDRLPGFALGVHSVPRDPGRLHQLLVVRKDQGLLHWVAAEYLFPGRQSGTLSITEDKLLTAGGFHDDLPGCARLVRDAAAEANGWPCDRSISYDYGVEINAFAKGHAAAAATGDRRLAEELRTLADRYLDVYQAQFLGADGGGAFSRQLSFVVLAVVTLLRATGDGRYRDLLRHMVELLLRFEQPLPDPVANPESGFLMGLQSDRDIHVDCHSAVLLALVRAEPLLGDARIGPAIDRGLNAFGFVSDRIHLGDGDRKGDGLGLRWIDGGGTPRVSMAYWNFHAALTLRLFRALRDRGSPAIAALAQRHAERIELFDTLLRWQVRRSTRQHADGLEIRTALFAGETNSETQPWCVLGLTGHPWD